MKLFFEKKLISPYTQDYVDVVDYKGFEITEEPYGWCVFYCGDDVIFDTLEEAKIFIDKEIGDI